MSQRAPFTLTLPLCPDHHRHGSEAEPSVHGHPTAFRAKYGTELDLLHEALLRVVAKLEAWEDIPF